MRIKKTNTSIGEQRNTRFRLKIFRLKTKLWKDPPHRHAYPFLLFYFYKFPRITINNADIRTIFAFSWATVHIGCLEKQASTLYSLVFRFYLPRNLHPSYSTVSLTKKMETAGST